MMLKQFIEQLNSDMRFEQPLEANEYGTYSLHLEPNLDISLKEHSNSIIMFQAALGSLPKQYLEDFLLKVMVGNLLGRETGGAALGLDKNEKLILTDFLIEEQDYKMFHERLELFANYAEAWAYETKEFIEKHEA